MKTKATIAAFVILVMASACAPKELPPDAQPAYKALQVLIRVDELQNATMSAYDQKLIDKALADKIVGFCIATAKTVKEYDTGWQGIVQASWRSFSPQVAQYIPDNLKVVWNLVGTVINSL